MSGEMDLPVFRKDLTAVHQDRGVEATDAVRLPDEFGVAEVEADAEPPGGVKEGLGFRPGHRGFEVGVRSRRVLEEVRGKNVVRVSSGNTTSRQPAPAARSSRSSSRSTTSVLVSSGWIPPICAAATLKLRMEREL